MPSINAIVIDTPAVDNILSGKNAWEMRSTATKQRGLVALIRKDSGTVVGIAELVDSTGPFSKEEILAHQSRHLISTQRLNDPKIAKWNKAWVMRNARPLLKPIPYSHPNGAVIWVNLDAQTSRAVVDAAKS